jgi:hypothetical protein
MRIAISHVMALAFAVAGCTASVEESLPLQQKAEAAEWRWSEHETNLLHCVRNQLKGYEIQAVRAEKDKDSLEPFTVRILDKGQEIYSFRAHGETVFTNTADVIFVAKFSPIATGCTVLAYDLKERKELWKCELKGNPPGGHSVYHHQVNITTDGGAVLVYGKESNGRYIEYVDAQTGMTVGHKKFPPER